MSTQRQVQVQTVAQQIERLTGHARQQGWDGPLDRIFRDDGYSGASLRRPGLDRPMSQDPHDQLLLQIRGAVAEHERTLITERMRRGRQRKRERD